MTPRIIGIHPIPAKQPVHLIEIDLSGCESEFAWISVTQPIADKDRSYWQVPYDEKQLPAIPGRWVFFFHFMDVARNLSSSLGEIELPPVTQIPSHLRFIRYEEP